MPGLFDRLFKRDPVLPPYARVYAEIVAQARQPHLYAELAVPDTPDGRFEMLVLHAFLVFERLKLLGPATAEFSQAVFDEMFRDLDHNLREMGVGDLSVGKRIRRMAEMFYGRAHAYEEALGGPETDAVSMLSRALARNVYAGAPGPGQAEALAQDVIRKRKALRRQPFDKFVSGEAGFQTHEVEERVEP